ncbi:hypothetical protein ACQ4WX_44885 [Streptomyces lasalocidi]
MTTETTERRIEACRSLLARLARFTGRTLRGEWYAIVVEPVRRLARRGLSGLLLAFVAAFGVIFFQAVAQHPLGRLWVTRLGGVKADLPLWLSLLRTPVSLYVPALDLPVWAGITQLFLAFAWAELTLGRARTLAISYITTLAKHAHRPRDDRDGSGLGRPRSAAVGRARARHRTLRRRRRPVHLSRGDQTRARGVHADRRLDGVGVHRHPQPG